MKFLLNILVFMSLVHYMISLNIIELNSPELLGLFDRSGEFKKLLTATQLSTIKNDQDKVFTFHVAFEEQCALKCLRNTQCLKYIFNGDDILNSCQVILSGKRQLSPEIKTLISNNINCDLNSCESGIYCSGYSVGGQEENSKGTCLCSGSSNEKECLHSVEYGLSSDWSEWTSCSASCDHNDGFKHRSKNCIKTYTNFDGQKITTAIPLMDWLCNLELTDKFQIESCSIKACKEYTEWSEWSRCSKICGGFTKRTRQCASDIKCDQEFLEQHKVCTRNDCENIVIGLESTSTQTGDIIKKGKLIFQNLISNKDEKTRIFSSSNEDTYLKQLGQLACSELGFKDLSHYDAHEVGAEIHSEYTDKNAFFDYLTSKTIAGIQCAGNEQTFKDCAIEEVTDYTKELYELEIECSYDGYWSQWDSWSECSRTCGAGAKTRTRTCSNPAPSISEFPGEPNGADCPNENNFEVTSCIKDKCDDFSGLDI